MENVPTRRPLRTQNRGTSTDTQKNLSFVRPQMSCFVDIAVSMNIEVCQRQYFVNIDLSR